MRSQNANNYDCGHYYHCKMVILVDNASFLDFHSSQKITNAQAALARAEQGPGTASLKKKKIDTIRWQNALTSGI